MITLLQENSVRWRYWFALLAIVVWYMAFGIDSALGVWPLLLLMIALFFRWQLRRQTHELRQQLQKQKQIEEALRQSEERLTKVLEILPVGVWITDRKGTILHGNQAGQTIWAGARYVGPEQFHEYKAWWLATGKRITPEEWGATRAITQGEVSCEEEIEIECFDGTRKIILNWAAPILSPEQQIEGAVAVNQDITRRKHAEEELQTKAEEQEWLLKSMINAFVIFQSVLNEQGQFISYCFEYINDAYEHITGVKLADVRGKTVHEVWPETEPAWVENYGAVAMTGVPREFDLYHAPTAKLYHCRVYRPWNTTARFCVVFEDITERKRNEEALREEHQLLSSVFNASPMGMFCLDRDSRVTLWGPAAEQMFGWKTEEVIGKFNPIVPAEKATEFFVLYKTVLEGNSIFSKEVRRQRKNGMFIDIYLSVSPLRKADGAITGAIGMFIDITERKQAEEALRASEARFRSYIDYAPNGVFIADEQGCYLEVNPAACKMTGYSAEELLRMRIADLALPKSFEAVPAHFQQVIQTGQASGEFPFRHKSGEIRYWSVEAVKLSPTRFMGFTQDVTDRMQAEAEILRLNAALEQRVAERTDQLEAANKELERFAYVTSHDLKAPLRGISQLAGWLLADYANVLDANGQKLCTLLSGRVKRMDALIDGILQYSRIGRISNAPEPTALAEIIADVLEMLDPPATIRISIPPNLPVVKGDRIRLSQVFQNLLSNALNFMDKPDGRITIGCKDGGAFWMLSVSDNGPGISPQHHERIFQIFQTLHARDEHESTGIGLAIVKKIVELHGGTIWVESAPGQGSTFFFTLPKTSDQDWCTGSSTQE